MVWSCPFFAAIPVSVFFQAYTASAKMCDLGHFLKLYLLSEVPHTIPHPSAWPNSSIFTHPKPAGPPQSWTPWISLANLLSPYTTYSHNEVTLIVVNQLLLFLSHMLTYMDLSLPFKSILSMFPKVPRVPHTDSANKDTSSRLSHCSAISPQASSGHCCSCHSKGAGAPTMSKSYSVLCKL